MHVFDEPCWSQRMYVYREQAPPQAVSSIALGEIVEPAWRVVQEDQLDLCRRT